MCNLDTQLTEMYNGIISWHLSCVVLFLWGALEAAYLQMETFTLSIGLGEKKCIYSPGYPNLTILGQFAQVIYTGPKNVYLHIAFDDLDLPERSIFKLYDGREVNTSRAFIWQPQYLGNSWSHPINIAESGSLFIHYIPPSTVTDQQYVGYKISIVASLESQWIGGKSPITVCPLIGDPMDGGTITLQKESSAFPEYYFDCIWQIKQPLLEDMEVFVVINKFEMKKGTLKVHRDGYSEGPLVEGIGIHVNDLRSGSIYIRVRKRLDDGEISFTYGVSKPAGEDTDCKFKYFYGEEEGYRCLEGWCIPIQHVCDGINNCPHTDDELRCKLTTALPLNLGEVITYGPLEKKPRLYMEKPSIPPTKSPQELYESWLKSNPGQELPVVDEIKEQDHSYPDVPQMSCNQHMKNCPDGTCIPFNDVCKPFRGKCHVMEKKCGNKCVSYINLCMEDCFHDTSKKICNNNQCVEKHERCPEDPCPPYKPYKCQDEGSCLYEVQVCDRVRNCLRGDDEDENCEAVPKIIFLLAAVIIVPMCVCLFVYMQQRNKQAMTETVIELSPTRAPASSRIHHRARPSPIVMSPPSYDEANLCPPTFMQIPRTPPPSYSAVMQEDELEEHSAVQNRFLPETNIEHESLSTDHIRNQYSPGIRAECQSNQRVMVDDSTMVDPQLLPDLAGDRPSRTSTPARKESVV